ncbi:MAG: DUF4350 domain-containing protein [Candidatus Tumulicola sp.]
MRARRVEITLLAGGLTLLALLAYGRQQAQQGGTPSIYSTYDVGPNGYRALYEVLRRSGVPVRRFDRVLPLLDADVRTLIISAYAGDPSAKGLDANDAAGLRRFVAGGGRLVVLDTDFAGPHDFTPGVGTSIPAHARDAIVLAKNRYTSGVIAVRAPIDAVFPFVQRRGMLPLLANDRGIAATSYHMGKGEVVAITVPALFGNAHLREGDNLAFAYDVVAGHGQAAFDEYVHGYDDDLGFWQALPAPVRAAFWIVCAIVGLALIGANVPFAPPVPVDPPDERDSSAYVGAMAALMRRARAARAATAIFAADAGRRARGRENVEGLRDSAAELEELAAIARPSDAVLVRAAILDFHLRKDRT